MISMIIIVSKTGGIRAAQKMKMMLFDISNLNGTLNFFASKKNGSFFLFR